MSPADTTTLVAARCTCGAFQFRSKRAPILQLSCHCGQCRAVSKAAFSNFAFFKRAECEMAGATAVQAFVADSGVQTYRESCAQCGEMVVDRTDGFPQIVGVVAERIQPPYAFQPRCHVWLDSRIAEVDLPPGVPGHARGMG